MRASSIAFVVGTAMSAAGCALVLGIDDGVPRGDADASVAPPDATPDAPADAGPDTSSYPLKCGTVTCNALAETCCRATVDGGSKPEGYSFRCFSGSASCTGTREIPVPCDNAATCAAQGHPGDVCCVNFDAMTFAAKDVACRAASACSADAGQSRLCETNADCVAPTTCQPSILTLVGFSMCK